MFVLPCKVPKGKVGTQVTFLGLKFAESSVQELLLLWGFSSACPLAFLLHHVEPQISQARCVIWVMKSKFNTFDTAWIMVRQLLFCTARPSPMK